MKYTFSIIIPYRDTYELLLKAVDSVPDRDDIQIIIVDNSAIPLSLENVPRKENARVLFLTSLPSKGAGCARNVGLEHAEGRFVLFLDADDYFMENAFSHFNEYIDKDYDIVYFKSDSINLKDGSPGRRHAVINQLIDEFNRTGDDGVLRYRFVNPIAKMIRAELIAKYDIRFEEVRVSNDVWFSIMTGHYAKSITCTDAAVYMITAGESGSSLTRNRTSENLFIRFQVMVRVNKFLKTVDAYKYHTRLSGFLRIVLREYGIKEFLRYLKYAHDNKVSIF